MIGVLDPRSTAASPTGRALPRGMLLRMRRLIRRVAVFAFELLTNV